MGGRSRGNKRVETDKARAAKVKAGIREKRDYYDLARIQNCETLIKYE